jgi:hypothetical protein
MRRILRIALSIFIISLLVSCSISSPEPITPSDPVTQTPLPTETQIEPTRVSTVTLTANESATPVTRSPDEILNSAVTNLVEATSFEILVHEVRAYQVIDRSGQTRTIYGEFDVDYSVICSPALKVHGSYQYRYNPQDDFLQLDMYTYQENGKYFIQSVENTNVSDVEEINPNQIEPFASDVYQTLFSYSTQAKFVEENGGTAIYVIEHPKWYTLKSAIGFADLGFLYMQENGENLVEQYVAEHYFEIKPIIFTMYVAVDELVITKVQVDDSDFMDSIWANADRVLIESGEDPENLTRYQVMDVNGAVYLFRNYNQVQDFEIPL